MRSFLSLSPGAAVQAEFQRILTNYRSDSRLNFVRWTKTHQLHLTLKFFAEITTQQSKDIILRLGEDLSQIASFEISAGRVGAFPDQRRPRILWVGLKDEQNSLEELHGKIEETLATLGYQREERAFHPHLTVGRIKKKLTVQQTDHLKPLFDDVGFTRLESSRITRIELMQSTLGPQGPTYTEIHSFQLGQSKIGVS